MTGFLDVMTMRLITRNRPATDLDQVLMQIRATPYPQLSQDTRQRLVLLLAIEHRRREEVRFGKDGGGVGQVSKWSLQGDRVHPHSWKFFQIFDYSNTTAASIIAPITP